MIDVTSEKLIGLMAVPSIPWLSKKPRVSTVYRWVTVGLKDRAGRTIRLEVVQEGGRMSTSELALLRFFERLRAISHEARTPSQMHRSFVRAEGILDAAGIA